MKNEMTKYSTSYYEADEREWFVSDYETDLATAEATYQRLKKTDRARIMKWNGTKWVSIKDSLTDTTGR